MLRAELNSYDRKFVKQGSLVKARLSHRQKRQLFLFSDVLLYAESSLKGFKLKVRDGHLPPSMPFRDRL